MEYQGEKYINPLTDFGFKKLFGSEPNKDLLIDFLNEILPDRKILDLQYAATEHMGRSEVDRNAIFDIYCKGDNGQRFIVEMQKAKQNFFKDRSVFYASFPIQEQAKKRDWNFKLDPIYSVGILDFIFDDHKNDSELVHVVALKDQKCDVFYDKLKFVYIELPKFKKTADELDSHFDKWLYVFTHLWKLQQRPKALQDRIFQKLFEVAEIAQFSKDERTAYENSLKQYRDIKNVVDTAHLEGMAKGIAEGMTKGIKQGMAKGREEGLEQGKLLKSIEFASALKQKGFSSSEIVALTGLTAAEIEQL